MQLTYARPSTDTQDRRSVGLSLIDCTTRWDREIPDAWSAQTAVILYQYRLGVRLRREATVTADEDFEHKIYYCAFRTRNENGLVDEQKPDISWIFLAAKANEDNGAGLVGKIIEGVNILIDARDFKGIDRALETVPAEENSSRHVLVAMARSTFPVRSKLSAWTRFVRSVEHSFAARGLDHSRLLKGLI